jgi:hypothetical protein
LRPGRSRQEGRGHADHSTAGEQDADGCGGDRNALYDDVQGRSSLPVDDGGGRAHGHRDVVQA